MNSKNDFSSLAPVRPKALPKEPDALGREVLRLRDEVIGLRARLAEADVVIKRQSEMQAISALIEPSVHVEYLQGVVQDLETQLADIRASATWRLGRLLVAPIRVFKRSGKTTTT